MVKDGELVVIDFQDALQGPRQYDLVALLRDSYVELDRAFVERMLDRYLAAFERASGAKLDRGRVQGLLRPAHRAAQAQGRGALRVHQPGEGQPRLPGVDPGVAALREGRRSSAGRELCASCARSSPRYVPELAWTRG